MSLQGLVMPPAFRVDGQRGGLQARFSAGARWGRRYPGREQSAGAVRHHKPCAGQQEDILEHEPSCAREVGKPVLGIAKRRHPCVRCRDEERQGYEGRQERQRGRASSEHAVGAECRRFRDVSRPAVNCDDDRRELSALSPVLRKRSSSRFRRFVAVDAKSLVTARAQPVARSERSQDGGTTAAAPVVCRSGVGTRQAGGSRSDVVIPDERSDMAISTRMTQTCQSEVLSGLVKLR
jgi:hypothetical protein